MKKATFSLVEMLGRAAPTVDIVDVGAMMVTPEDVAYKELSRRGAARVVGFEPVQAECDKLNAMKQKNHLYLPYFIGDGAERTFHLCNFPMTSSLYEPDTALLRRFNFLEELTRVTHTSRVQTRRLDDIPEITAMDFLKVDVQGADLDVMRGAERLLAGTLVVHTEVEFLPMYKGQPLYSDVDSFLRGHGFLLHALTTPCGRAFKPLQNGKDPAQTINQVLWADGVWVRDFRRFKELTPEQLLKIACILHETYGSMDLAALALQYHEEKTRQGLWEVYLRRIFKQLPHLPETPPLD